MLVGISKFLIVFPFIPYLIFWITSKSRKLAHVYCGPVVATCNIFLLKEIFNILFIPIVLLAYFGVALYLTFKKLKKKKRRKPKKFWMYFSYFLSKVGFKIYIVLVIIGTIMEMMK